MSGSGPAALYGKFEVLVDDYRRWLVTERCLAPSTVEYLLREAGRFLADRDGPDLRSLTLGEVMRSWCSTALIAAWVRRSV